MKSQLRDCIRNWENQGVGLPSPSFFVPSTFSQAVQPPQPVAALCIVRPIAVVASGPFPASSPAPSSFAASFPSPHVPSHLPSPFAPCSPPVPSHSGVASPFQTSSSATSSPPASLLPPGSLTTSTPDARSIRKSPRPSAVPDLEEGCDWCYSKSIPCCRDTCHKRKKKCSFTRADTGRIDRHALKALVDGHLLLSSKCDAIAINVSQQSSTLRAMALKFGVGFGQLDLRELHVRVS